jgi:NitT/TauT family transport system substrate-binding protein
MFKLSACILASALAYGTAFANEKLVINQSGQTTTASSVYLAKHLGFFEKEGLDVTFVVTGSGIKSIAPLVNGATQFCACIVSHPMQANSSGAAETRLIASITAGFPTKVALRKDHAERLGLKPDMPLADRMRMLKGMKVGVTELGASTDQALREAMKVAGMNPERDAVIIALGGVPNQVAALENNQVDAISASPPAPERVIKDGAALLLADPMGEHVGNLDVALFMALAAEKSYLDKHRDIALRVVRAVYEGQKYLQDHRAESAKVVKEKEFPNMQQEAFDIAFDGQFPTFSKTPELTRQSVDAVIKLNAPTLPGPAGTYETLVDPSYAKQVLGN